MTVSREQTFLDLGLLVAQAWSGVDGVANFAQQLEAQQAQLGLCSQRLENQQAQLHQQQQPLEQHLRAQQAQTALTETALAVVASEVGARPGRTEATPEGGLDAGNGRYPKDPWSGCRGGSDSGPGGGSGPPRGSSGGWPLGTGGGG